MMVDGKELHRESLCASENDSGITSTNTSLNADTQPLSKTHVFQGPQRECSVLLIIYRCFWMCTRCWCPLLRCWTFDFPWLWVCSRVNKPLPKLVILFTWLCKGTMEIHRLQGCRRPMCFHKMHTISSVLVDWNSIPSSMRHTVRCGSSHLQP